MNLDTPLITTDKSSVQELEIRLFKIEETCTHGKLIYLYESSSVCLIQFGNLVSYF